MLILRRKEGQWIEITHRSGDKIRIRVCNIRARYPGQLDMVLDDPDHHFVIQRAERGCRGREPLSGSGDISHAIPSVAGGPIEAGSGVNPALGIAGIHGGAMSA